MAEETVTAVVQPSGGEVQKKSCCKCKGGKKVKPSEVSTLQYEP